jgi:hypothetical protein
LVLGRLKQNNKTAYTFINVFQFVELRKFIRPGQMWDKEMLAKQVLAEIPQQVVQWMNVRKIQPGAAAVHH